MQMSANRRFVSNSSGRDAGRLRFLDFKNKTGSSWSYDERATRPVFTVREFIVPPHQRMVEAIASAEILRDVAAFAALVVFGTMISLVLGGSGSFG